MGAASATPGQECGGRPALLQGVGAQDFRLAVPEAGDSQEGVAGVTEEVSEVEHDIQIPSFMNRSPVLVS